MVIKVGDRVNVVTQHGDEADADLVGFNGVVVQRYPDPHIFDVRVHMDGDPSNEFRVFNDDELEVL